MSLPVSKGVVLHRTKKGVEVVVYPGKKKQSRFDFIVRYREPGKKTRTPRHIHVVIDLYLKKSADESLTMELLDHIIDNIIRKVVPSTRFPPELQVFSPTHVSKFQRLNQYGEYDVEFLLVIVELIMIQEKTNYPSGTMNLKLFERFRREDDIFSVVSAATFH